MASADSFVQNKERLFRNVPVAELGKFTLDDDTKVDIGRALSRGTWSAALRKPLVASFNNSESLLLSDVLFHRNRDAGMCETVTEYSDYLTSKASEHFYSLM